MGMERKWVFTAAASCYSWFLFLHPGRTELQLQGITQRQMTPPPKENYFFKKFEKNECDDLRG